MALHGPHQDVIDLVSDSEDEVEFVDAWEPERGHTPLIEEDDEAFYQELLAFEAEEAMGVAAGNNEYENPIVLEDVDRTIIGTDECLQLILNVLPDISIDYALGLIIEQTEDGTRCSADCERLIMMLLDQGAYPKEADEVNKRKRKRDNGDADGEVAGDLATSDPDYLKDALDLLKDEFQYAPVPHIRNTLAQEGTLLKAFVVIEQQLRVYDKSSSRSIKKIQKPRARGDFTTVLAHKPIIRELEAARARIAKDAAKRQEEVEQKHAEERNIELAKRNNEMNDCLCCFDEYPLNRMVSCDGDVIHLFCRECARRYVEEEMSKSRCRPICFADPNCGGTFTRQQLLQFLGPKTFERLEHLQQQEDVAAAGLEDLCDCPFCDFKQECPPVEVDREFRCLNPTCGKTSCRFCNTETHIPKTCEEAKKDKNISVRHTVEEAKSEALIRNCNNCKSPFVKDEGCNKMTCTKCRNVQCYVCSKNVTDYNHFGSNDNRNRCPLHDNVEKRHQDEIKKAEADALARIRAEHPDIPEEELQIKVSDVVKASEQARQGRAEAQHNGFGFQMNGPNLVRAPQIPPHIGLPIEVPPWNPIPFQPNPPAPPAPAPAPAPAPRPVLQPNAPEAFGVGQLVGQLRRLYDPQPVPGGAAVADVGLPGRPFRQGVLELEHLQQQFENGLEADPLREAQQQLERLVQMDVQQQRWREREREQAQRLREIEADVLQRQVDNGEARARELDAHFAQFLAQNNRMQEALARRTRQRR